MSTFLFSYGTLQLESVQIASFGRILKGHADAMTGYKLSYIEITDKEVLAKSSQHFHPIAIPSANAADTVEGIVFEVTAADLLKADEYEVEDYVRVEVELLSGKKAWVYVLKEYVK